MIINDKLVFRSTHFPENAKPFGLIQEHAARAYLFFFALWACGLYLFIANHMPVLGYGIIGIISVFLLSNLAGMVQSKMQYVEIGFSGAFFYMVNVYDIAFEKEIQYYPSSFSNAARDGFAMHINYHGQIIRLKREDWPEWEELFAAFYFIREENNEPLQ